MGGQTALNCGVALHKNGVRDFEAIQLLDRLESLYMPGPWACTVYRAGW